MNKTDSMISLFVFALLAAVPLTLHGQNQIDFESIPGGMPIDGMMINTQFEGLFGVRFSLENGESPVLARVGAPQTAFEGFMFEPDQPAPGAETGEFFLTDDGLVAGPPSALIVGYVQPVASASGLLLDVDNSESWLILARNRFGETIGTVEVGPNNSLDGSATIWSFEFEEPVIQSLRFGFTGNGNAVGLAFDNFSPSTPAFLGDVNCDGEVNLLDVAPFVDLLTDGRFTLKADINQDGVVDLLDVAPFVNLLSGG